MEKIKRFLWAHFLNTGTKWTEGSSGAVWSRINKGVTDLTVDYNAEVTEEQYIGEQFATASIDSFAPSSSVEQIAFKGDAVFELLDNMRRERAIGEACEVQLLNVEIYSGAESAYTAEMQPAVIEITSFGGEGNVSIGYTIHYSGTPTKGTATINGGTVTFTA